MRVKPSAAALQFCLLVVLGVAVLAEEGGEVGGARVGPGKAVTEASEINGLRLSALAIKTIGLEFSPVKARGVQRLPSQSLIRFRQAIGVYRLRQGWFKLVEVRLLEDSVKEARLESPALSPGDQVVTRGSPFLRAAELDIFGVKEDDE